MVYPTQVAVTDETLKMKDAGLVAASAVAQVGGADRILDLGAEVYMRGRLFLHVTAVEAASNDELFRVELQGSNAANFSPLFVLANKALGAAETTFDSADTPTGLYVIPFDNVATTAAGVSKPVRYLRLNTRVAGTIATGVNYEAWIVKD